MKNRQEIFAEIEFESRKKNKKGIADITITTTKRANSINIYFRNGMHELFPEGVIFGIYKNRIVFEPDKDKGYTVNTSATKKGDIGVVTATVGDIEKYRAWVGDYEMKYDDFYEFWYIEKPAE